MKAIIPAMLGMCLLVLCGCATPQAEFVPPTALLFNNFKAPLLVDYDEAIISRNGGNASSSYVYDVLLTKMSLAWDDCSLDAAAENGRFSRVGAADYEFFSFLGVFAKTTVHVYEAPTVEK